jgi:four helix bundle protein
MDFVDIVYGLTSQLPDSERFNLRSQLERAATSIVLNIAEGSTGQSDLEQHRFLGLAMRSYLECIACMDLIEKRKYLNSETINAARTVGHRLFVKLQSFSRGVEKITGPRSSVSGLSVTIRLPSPVRSSEGLKKIKSFGCSAHGSC